MAAAAACGGPAADDGSEPAAPPPAPGTAVAAPSSGEGPSGARRAPPHRFATLDGEEAGLDELRGNVAVVNFWGTWCLPCRRELPELAELAAVYSDRPVRLVGIAVDSGEPDEIEAFLEDYGVDYPIWTTEMDVAVVTFGALGFPLTLVIDPDGWIRKELLGPQTLASLAREIDALLP